MGQPKKVTKAVIAAAGFGTRFLPQTKSVPKEMLPLVDKPIIQYIVEDMVAAGIEDIIIVGSSNKRPIEDHFDFPNEDLLANLRAGGAKKQPYIDEVERVADLANFIYLRQKGPYGTATPIYNAAHLIGDEPFIFAFADDVFVCEPGQPNAFKQMIDAYERLGGGILPCIKIADAHDYGRYGMLEGQEIGPDVLEMSGIIEKPGKDASPSNFASVGGYLLPAEVLQYLDRGIKNLEEGKEFVVTDCLVDPMLKDGHKFYGIEIKGTRYDAGEPLGYMKTFLDFGLKHPEYGPALREYLHSKNL